MSDSNLAGYMHPCEVCGGTGTEEFEYGMRHCSHCEGTGIEPSEPEPTRDEFLEALREAWSDVQNRRTHILHDFTDFFSDELGEE